MHHENPAHNIGSKLIASLSKLRDQLKVATEGTVTVPITVPDDEIYDLASLNIGILQIRRGNISTDRETKTYALVFDLARLNLNNVAELPTWIEDAKFFTSDGTKITFRKKDV